MTLILCDRCHKKLQGISDIYVVKGGPWCGSEPNEGYRLELCESCFKCFKLWVDWSKPEEVETDAIRP